MIVKIEDLVVGSKVFTSRWVDDVPRFTEGEVIDTVYRPFKFGNMQKDYKVLLETGRVVVLERADLNKGW